MHSCIHPSFSPARVPQNESPGRDLKLFTAGLIYLPTPQLSRPLPTRIVSQSENLVGSIPLCPINTRKERKEREEHHSSKPLEDVNRPEVVPSRW